MQKTWIFIGRLNPPHIWHIKIIEKSLSENDKTLLFLWSIDKNNENNIFSYEKRKKVLEMYFERDIKSWKIIITWIKDYESDIEWVEDINLQISKEYKIKENDLTFYCWDEKEDYAINIIKRYKNILDINEIKIIEVSRKNSFIIASWKKILISSSQIRKSLINNDKEIVKNMMKEEIFYELF